MVDATRFFGTWLRAGEGIGWLAAGTICQTLSIECPSSIFFWPVYFVIHVPFSLSFFVCLFFFCSHWSLVDVPLIFFCPADHVPDWQPRVVVVVVVVFTLTDRASIIPSNIRGCQSGTWSQRGTKVNGSHHGDNPLLRPTGIQIATKSYATLQAMAPTNNKTVHQTSFTPYYREQPRSTRIVFAYPRPAFSATNRTNTFQPVLINNSKFIKATHRTKIRKIEIPRSMVVEALSC